MFGRARRLAEAGEDLATLQTKYDAIRHQLDEKTAECETWKAQAAPAGRIADRLITRTREAKTVRETLRETEDQLGQARKRLAAQAMPARGDAVEVWLKAQRDVHSDRYGVTPAWYVLDDALDRYRLHADTGTPLDQHACDGPHCDCAEVTA